LTVEACSAALLAAEAARHRCVPDNHKGAVMKRLILAIAAIGALATPLLAQANWPSRPVKLVVPFAAGGSADTLGRSFGEQLSTALGQQVVIENQGAAGGLVGSAAVARSQGDGYTLVVSGIASHVIAPSTNPNPGFDPMKDFTHIAYFGGPPIVMIAHPSLGVKSLKELLELAKKSKDPLGYVSPGAGTLGNLVAEFWADKEKAKLEHIPYKGASQALNDLLGGHVKVGSMTFTTAAPQIRAGTVVPLAVSSANRLKEFPDLPTFKELGYPDLVATTWFSLSGPKGMPADIVSKINAAVDKAKDSPEVQKRLATEAMETEKMSADAFTKFMADELAKWGALAKATFKP
jgi:tripartite-type tricarboxylate transporter receptor subunit TctC